MCYHFATMEMDPKSTEQISDKDLRKQEQAARDRRAARKEKMKPVLKLLGIVVAVAAVLGGLIWLGEMQDGTDQPSPLTGEVTDLDHVQGPDDARVTVIEYADFQCPTCAAFAPVMERLVDEYPDDLRLVVRHFPLKSIHPNATLAAEAAEAASLQDKFWEMHDILFERQSEWRDLGNPRDTFEGYAQEIGLDVERFKTDINSKAVKDRVDADYDSATGIGLSGTPSFFVNGEALEDTPQGYEAFKALIEDELN